MAAVVGGPGQVTCVLSPPVIVPPGFRRVIRSIGRENLVIFVKSCYGALVALMLEGVRLDRCIC